MAAPSWQDLFDTGRAEAIDRQPALSFNVGDITEMLVAAMAAIADHLTGYFAGRVLATYLDGATGADLTTLADDHWNIQRFLALQAAGTVEFTRVAATAGAGVIPAGTIIATERDSTGREVQYETAADINVGALTLTVTGSATCTEAGKVGNADTGKVDRVISTLFDTSFTVANTTRMAGGDDEETDEDLRDRVRSFPTTIRRGTLAAQEYGAKQVAGVKRATAVEEVVDGNTTGIVNLYVTDIDGNSSGPMITDVTAEIENWRPAGNVVNVLGGSLYTLTPIVITLAVRTGVDVAAITADVKSAIVARIGKLKIGETCYRSMIRQAAMNVDPDGIQDVTVVQPGADVVPSSSQIIRTSTGDVTVS